MRLKPGAKVFLGLIILFLFGFGAYRLHWLDGAIKTIAPEKHATGKVDASDFSFGKSTPQSDTPATGESKPAGGKLNRPIKVAIVLWGGYAGGIMANGGFKPNQDSVFYKDHGIEVQIVQIDDFQASRDAFRAGGRAVDIMWSTVDATPWVPSRRR